MKILNEKCQEINNLLNLQIEDEYEEKKEVDIKLLQLSCNEFTGRLSREAFPLCNIKIADIKYSKIDLTMNEEGRISSFDNSLNLAETKKLCLSGYVANRPAMSVGADFTCRVLIQ